ncbi:GspH/FimT family pseudopilin [Lamprobacter modestohalophilus]|nr:GspH/FimT family pseudopilin [Lamprobacter modestohalophilus]
MGIVVTNALMPRRLKRRSQRQDGFTLVELIVVLAIGGLLLALTPPLITAALPGVELKAGARRAAGALRQTREIAVASGIEATWLVDIETGRYRIEGQGRQGGLPDDIEIELIAAQDELRSESLGGIRFFPDGSSTGGRLILKRGEGGYQVGVNWLTGRILVVDWEPE